jgi:catecholate siderophore receptor
VGAATLLGLTALGAPATALADMPVEVSSVQVTGASAPLDVSTDIAVLPTTVQDTPQAIQVITAEQLRTQGVATLEQALRQVPGITVSIGEGGVLNGDQFKIRGFSAQEDVYVDGLRDFGVYTRDSFALDSVQVLKGPSGALFGRGAVGGAINLISRRPQLDNFSSVDLYVGNGSYYRGLADINHMINDTTAVRLSLMVQDSEVVDRDYITTQRWGVQAGLGLGIGTPTTFNLNYLHQNDNRRPDYGIIIVQRPGELIGRPASEYNVGVERSTFLGLIDDADNTQADVLTARFATRINDKFSITSSARYGLYSRYFQYSTTDNCSLACNAALFDGDPTTLANAGMGGSGPYDMTASGAQSLTTVRFDSQGWPLRTQIIAGADFTWQRSDKLYYAYTLPAGITARNQIPRNLVDPDPAMPAGYARYLPSAEVVCPVAACSAVGTTVLRSRGNGVSYGGFLIGRVWFNDQVSVIGSARWDHFDASLHSRLVDGTGSIIRTSSDVVNPRVSLLWEPNDLTTVYATWGRSAIPAGNAIINANIAFTALSGDLDPEVTTAWEIGAKFGLMGGRLAFTAAAFDITKDNASQPDPNGSGNLIVQTGEQDHVRGVEFSLIGRVARGWNVNATYTYLDSEIRALFINCAATTIPCPAGIPSPSPVLNTFAVGRDVYWTPRHSGSVWVTWDVPDTGLQLGLGANYQSKVYTSYIPATVGGVTSLARIAEIPSTTNFDAFAAYNFGRYRIAINAYNLADELYYVQSTNNRGVPAPGRTVVLSLGARF